MPGTQPFLGEGRTYEMKERWKYEVVFRLSGFLDLLFNLVTN